MLVARALAAGSERPQQDVAATARIPCCLWLTLCVDLDVGLRRLRHEPNELTIFGNGRYRATAVIGVVSRATLAPQPASHEFLLL